MDFVVTFRQGGMIETRETGIYPEWLIITSKSLKRTWRVKCSDGVGQGILQMNKKPAFEYSFNEEEEVCFITAITDTLPRHSATFPVDHVMYD